MKKLIITCALLAGASMVSTAQTTTAPTPSSPNGVPPAQARPAQGQMTPEMMADRREKMDEKMFNLTPDQTKPVYNAELEFMTAMMKFRSEGKQPTPVDMQNLQAKKDEKMKTILTADQYAKYDVARNRQRNAPMTPGQQQQMNGQPAPQPAAH